MPLVVYTDGACSGNPGPGGWAWAVADAVDGRRGFGSEAHSTNQRMEIAAALGALRSLGPTTEGPIEIVSDSTYVVNCFRDRWWAGWLSRGWRNTAKQPVANRDLWEPLVDLYRARADGPGAVRFRWVKGHSGDPMNDLVDRLAVAAANSQSATTVVEGADRAAPVLGTVAVDGLPLMGWLRPPREPPSLGPRSVAFTADGGTDWFSDPLAGPPVLDAPALLFPVGEDFTLSARVTVEAEDVFDAGALVLYQHPDSWAKLALEYSPRRQCAVVSVVTRETSDDGNHATIAGPSVFLRIARVGPAYCFHVSLDDRQWDLVRLFRLADREASSAGLLVQSPAGDGCRARFDELRYTPRTIRDVRDGT